MIVIGLGSGRSGTASLSKLLNSQKNSHCFHELNPSCISHFGTEQPIINTINEFQTILNGGNTSKLTVDFTRNVSVKSYAKLVQKKNVELIGDIAHYYLSYVDTIAKLNSNVRFVCLKRNKEDTVKSWLKKTSIHRWRSKKIADRFKSIIMRTPYYQSYNHWIDHSGEKWKVDPIWDKCFPKFKTHNKKEAIEMYWDYYYEKADDLASKLKEIFLIVDIKKLNSSEGQSEILTFCGVPIEKQNYISAHIHRSIN